MQFDAEAAIETAMGLPAGVVLVLFGALCGLWYSVVGEMGFVLGGDVVV
ncbi:hypothetical protein [Micromonospora sp. WP24]|nr:hypothetical protein [Micromonospora sp. WP24]